MEDSEMYIPKESQNALTQLSLSLPSLDSLTEQLTKGD